MTDVEDKNSIRSDGDSWDIVSSVGYTALGVSAQRAVESERPDALIVDPFAKHFVLAAGEPHLIDTITKRDAPQASPFEYLRGMGMRSRFFDEFFLDAAASGIRQAVILAAGLDARAHRLSWPAGVTVYELDQPQVLAFKDRVYAEQGAAPTSDRRTVAVDLRDDWPAALKAAGFDSSQPTAWSAEGLLPYLPAAAQELLFERVAELSAPGSRAAIEGPTGVMGMSQFAKVEQKYRSEKDTFGKIDITELFYDEEKTPAIEWFSARGWKTQGLDMFALADRYSVQHPEVPEDIRELAGAMHYLTCTLPN
ncbi:putative S-adenosyl-L-methionine-dependent methyltransferase [Mycobacteroides salmoniphilum]|uniref:S-adenosyl-L-methionine-dependent methyltransferase n=1 Tax=Mycobacteroides salmoniphilum TaxID=404941 RepID=A0A4R8S121_9MYCO|nr:class I SAM-dependent methyltransferase [Mycobacteroides salmoniphilum]TDZ76495.1 putative S-adenosyl-L-methionine-dependent methyltransferase [Mycobacteroides salmoniphilum]TDZ78480.1 putative S-adenosyl-L-methionine-dependent methyltransferase [Mycobacteroides salmoniphilum]TDZ85013.1 putative S-adenosyl-L-methionine-dependent methyltransferase [Mycobacteroides salmoniphilum]